MRRAIGLAAIVASLAVSSPAWALDAWMWGVGPKLGTTFLPGRAPVLLPQEVRDEGAIPKKGADVIFGADALYYASSTTRLGVDLGADIGGNMFSVQGMLSFDRVLQQQALDFTVGGETGAATTTYNGDGTARLVVNSFPLRAKAGIILRDNARAYGGSIFGQFDLPSRQIYTQLDGTKLDGHLKPGLYVSAGIEINVLFGDFTPPRTSVAASSRSPASSVPAPAPSGTPLMRASTASTTSPGPTASASTSATPPAATPPTASSEPTAAPRVPVEQVAALPPEASAAWAGDEAELKALDQQLGAAHADLDAAKADQERVDATAAIAKDDVKATKEAIDATKAAEKSAAELEKRKLEVLKANVDTAKAAIATAQALVGAREDEVKAAKLAIDEAKEQLKLAKTSKGDVKGAKRLLAERKAAADTADQELIDAKADVDAKKTALDEAQAAVQARKRGG